MPACAGMTVGVRERPDNGGVSPPLRNDALPLSRPPTDRVMVAAMRAVEPTSSPMRLPGVDVARGAALFAMAVYHFAWDLHFFGLIATDPVVHPAWMLFARGIAASFLLLVGVSLVLAAADGFDRRAFLIRLAKVSGAALLITAATMAAFPDSFIFFGILHHIAAASVLGLLALRLPTGAVLGLAGTVFVLPVLFQHPAFSHPALVWLGLAPVPPRSNDFVPLLPWFGWVLAGIAAGRALLGAPRFVAAFALRPASRPARVMAAAGRHSLTIYLLHQPILIGLVWLAVQLGVARPIPAGSTDFGTTCTAECIAQGAEAALCRRVCSCIVEDLAGGPLLADRAAPLSAADERRLSEAIERCRNRP